MKKILIITNHSYMFYQFRRELTQKLLESHEVVLAVPFGEQVDALRDMGLRLIDTPLDRRGINPGTDMKLLRQYQVILKKEKPDMVITYSIKPNIYAGFACRMAHIPYYANVQGLGTAFQKKGLSQLVTAMYKTALKKARRVFFENQANAREFLDRGIVDRDKVVVLHGAGVNLERFAYQPYPSEEKGIHFLYLGRIMKEKGMDELFVAAERIKQKYGDKVVFDLVGFFEDGYKERVEQLAQEGIVVFHGFQSDPRPYYAMAHCVVLPSYHEGMSNVLLEAAATGRALIASDIPGCREAVLPGRSGYLVETKNDADLEQKIEMFLSETEESRRAMGQTGRTLMEQEFSKSAVVAETVNHLQ